MNNSLFIYSALALTMLCSFQADNINYVPDKKTAIKIAKAVIPPLYGRKILYGKRFSANLVGDTVWQVSCHYPPLPKARNGFVYIRYGGYIVCEIRRKDGTILKVMGYK